MFRRHVDLRRELAAVWGGLAGRKAWTESGHVEDLPRFYGRLLNLTTMHFSKTYDQLLLELPQELRDNAIEYRRLKKLIKQVVEELTSIGNYLYCHFPRVVLMVTA